MNPGVVWREPWGGRQQELSATMQGNRLLLAKCIGSAQVADFAQGVPLGPHHKLTLQLDSKNQHLCMVETGLRFSYRAW